MIGIIFERNDQILQVSLLFLLIYYYYLLLLLPRNIDNFLEVIIITITCNVFIYDRILFIFTQILLFTIIFSQHFLYIYFHILYMLFRTTAWFNVSTIIQETHQRCQKVSSKKSRRRSRISFVISHENQNHYGWIEILFSDW